MWKEDIFSENTNHNRNFKRELRKQPLFIFLLTITAVVLLFVGINFTVISRFIAATVASILTTGIPIFVFALIIIWGVIKMKWRMCRRFWW